MTPASSAYVDLHILIKNKFSSKTAQSRLPPCLLWEHRCTGTSFGFATVFAVPKSLDYGTWDILQTKGKRYGCPKISSRMQTIWQM
jgi:hypothetical protein